jgi:hypothetical protein
MRVNTRKASCVFVFLIFCAIKVYPQSGLTFIGTGTDCSVLPDPANNPFTAMLPPVVSQQNTADTPSKVLVVDVDGDGVPESIVAGKFGNNLRVIRSQAEGQKAAGSIKSIIEGKEDAKFMFELELTAGDIDGDGIVEIFAIQRRFKSSGDIKPLEYYVAGYRYALDDLEPLWDPDHASNVLSVGTVDYSGGGNVTKTTRPGTLGLADFDNDGLAELYFRDWIIAAETGKVIAIGNAAANWLTDVSQASVAVNIDKGSSNMELVEGPRIWNVPSLSANRALTNPAPPVTLTQWKNMNNDFPTMQWFPKNIITLEYSTDHWSSNSIADFDKDGEIDVFITGATGSNAGPTAVFYWNVANNTLGIFEPPNNHAWGTGRVNLGDINGDGNLNATFTTGQ